MVAGSVTALPNFLGQQPLSLRIVQSRPQEQLLGRNAYFQRGRQSLPSHDCAMLLGEAESRPRLAKLTNEKLNLNVNVNA